MYRNNRKEYLESTRISFVSLYLYSFSSVVAELFPVAKCVYFLGRDGSEEESEKIAIDDRQRAQTAFSIRDSKQCLTIPEEQLVIKVRAH